MTRIPVHPDPETDNRTIPFNPKPFPYSVKGSQVIAAALFPARTGERPNLAYMVLREEGRPILRQYAVVTATAEDDGEWQMCAGTYDCSYANAMEIFMEQLNYRI